MPSVAGPKRPQDRIELPNLKQEFVDAFSKPVTENGFGKSSAKILSKSFPCRRRRRHAPPAAAARSRFRSSAAKARNTNPSTELEMANNRPTPDQSLRRRRRQRTARSGMAACLIAAITSCTNTSNPSVMLAAGLLAKKAVERGLQVNPLVKTSLAPGSRVVTDYLNKTGLQPYLDQARLQPRRLRLHDLHRQFRPAARADRRSRSASTIWSPPRCFPAIAISKRACIRASKPIS